MKTSGTGRFQRWSRREGAAFGVVAALYLAGGGVSILQGQTTSAAWNGHGGDPQHTAISAVPTQSLQAIRWMTSVDENMPNPPILIHYGSPVITAENTVVVPVRTTSGFRVEARAGSNGALLWSAETDFKTAPTNGNWTPSFSPTLTPNGTLYYQGSGGTVYRVNSPNTATATPAPVAINFLPDYAARKAEYDSSVYISTPITSDTAGNIYFGFETKATAPGGLASGLVRIDVNGNATYTSASTALGINGATGYRLGTNSAPALSRDGSTLYLGLNGAGTDYLAAVNSTTLAPVTRVALSGTIRDAGSSSPTIGPDGQVYFGSMPGINFRGNLEHFSADLSQRFVSGSFGWDETVSIVPAAMVPSYHGTSQYLVFSKYNNYAGAGGDGVNKLAILDPNASQIDPVTGQLAMKEVLTIAGITPDPTLPAVREWCINTAAVDPATKSILVNSEDGFLYRWNLATNTFTEAVELVATGAFEAYTPTVVGPDGTVYAINRSVLFAVGIPEPGSWGLLLAGMGLGLGRRWRRRMTSS